MLGAARRLSEPNFVFGKHLPRKVLPTGPHDIDALFEKLKAALFRLPEEQRDQKIAAACKDLIGKNQLILAHRVACLMQTPELRASVIASIRCDKK